MSKVELARRFLMPNGSPESGTLQGDYFVVCVLDPHEYSEGKIVPGSAFAEFKA